MQLIQTTFSNFLSSEFLRRDTDSISALNDESHRTSHTCTFTESGSVTATGLMDRCTFQFTEWKAAIKENCQTIYREIWRHYLWPWNVSARLDSHNDDYTSDSHTQSTYMIHVAIVCSPFQFVLQVIQIVWAINEVSKGFSWSKSVVKTCCKF